MKPAAVSIDDKYRRDGGRSFMSGTQALVRLALMQRWRDAAAGLNTAGFISGYRGSPLAALDRELWRASAHLERERIVFQPGLNEDLAATAVWGSQQIELFPGARYDGVFGIWYGKSPGVDRSGDALKHANAAGTSRNGGVLALAGDDHVAQSSSLACQSEFAFADAMIPVLVPAGIQEFIDFGLLGIALSRFSGLWVGMKLSSSLVESSATVEIDPDRLQIADPDDFETPAGGVHIRWPDVVLAQEARLHQVKLPAALAFARANGINRMTLDSRAARVGIVTTGKSYLDVRQALDQLGIGVHEADALGLRLMKIGMAWPLDAEKLGKFAEGLEQILVVEEKRPLIEDQLKAALYGRARMPRIVGKTDERGAPLFPPLADLEIAHIAGALGERLLPASGFDAQRARLQRLGQRAPVRPPPLVRAPHFCSGCPHNRSTKVPEGSLALGGIGCHSMALFNGRAHTFTHMGAEGATWIGLSPFTETEHVFQNLGDGTYFHSGSLAIRAAIAAGVNITYKILFNDAVAMTGGQPIDGQLTVQQLTRQLSAEGIGKIVVVSDDPGKYSGAASAFADGVGIHHRDEMEQVSVALRAHRGVSAIVYDQVCAAEKRRRRKRGLMPDPARRVFINEMVCEGCGDCGRASGCLSVVPVDTPFGRKRRIDQFSCNKDFSCIDGFCPSFVSVEGGRLRRPAPSAAVTPLDESLPEPALAPLDQPYGIVIAGVGGTGVVTIGAVLAMAAHLSGLGCSVFDMMGLAQKGGAVHSHVVFAGSPQDLRGPQIARGQARLLLGCDLVVAASPASLEKLASDTSFAIVNLDQAPVGAHTINPDLGFPADALKALIVDACGPGQTEFVDATRLAANVAGDTVATNMLMLGAAYQRGLLPVGQDAILEAIALNGAAVELNRHAFALGRRLVLGAVAEWAPSAGTEPAPSLDDLVESRSAFLEDYQNAELAGRYRALVARVRDADGTDQRLPAAVARAYAKLLAYKDEWEVARLYASPQFRDRLAETFEGDYRLAFHLAPPLLARRDPVTKHARKRRFGGWVLPLFHILARLRFLRGTWLDPFGYAAERRAERALIGWYEDLVDRLLPRLPWVDHALAEELLALPEQIRGFGHVKAQSIAAAKAREAALWQQIDGHAAGESRPSAAADRAVEETVQ